MIWLDDAGFGSCTSCHDFSSQVMSAVETKSPGTFTRGVREKFSDEKVSSPRQMWVFGVPSISSVIFS